MEPLTFTSDLPADPEEVWRHATSLEGIHHELGPWMQMSAPSGVSDLTNARPPLGTPWFRSTLRIGGVLPYDRMHLRLTEFSEEDLRFAESSSMLWMRSWRHERWIEPVQGGCRITDRITAVPRLPGTGVAVRRIVRLLFRWRHRRLRQRFGVLESGAGWR